MIRRGLAGMLLLAAGCAPGGDGKAAQPAAADLERAAIERGLIPDPDDIEIAGLYGRDTDRVCIVRDGIGYRVGALVEYGEGIHCSGAGRLTRAGETVHLQFGTAVQCSFEARLAGDRILFPGALPSGCAALCRGRASFAGLEAGRISDSKAEAAALRDASGRRLCGD